jgi:hypothetical protein
MTRTVYKYAGAAAVFLIVFLIIRDEIKKAARRKNLKADIPKVEPGSLRREEVFYKNFALRAYNAFEPWAYNYSEKKEILEGLLNMDDNEFLTVYQYFERLSPDYTLREWLKSEWFDPPSQKAKEGVLNKLNRLSLP